MLRKVSLSAFTFISLLVMSSCKKDSDLQQQSPVQNGDTASYLQIKASGLQLPGQTHFAIISINNQNGQALIQNKKVTLDFVQGKYITDKVSLAKGRYKLTKFIVTNERDTAVYATPLANSEKAQLVLKPLQLDLSVTNPGVTVADAEVIPVTIQDSPASFGYTAADFGFLSFLTLKAKLKITLGQVVYDSLPGRITIDAVDNLNNHWIRDIDFGSGIATLRVPDNYVRYTFKTTKWNVPIERIFPRSALFNNYQVSLESVKALKRLAREVSYMELSTGLKEDSRAEYFYGTSNTLSSIRYYQRLPQYAELQLTNTFTFQYTGVQLDTISRLSPDNSRNGFTAFSYSNGRISGMHNKSYDQQTFAAVEYTGTALNPRISIDYLFSNGNSMVYRMNYSGGNKVNENSQSSTGGNQSAVFGYDNNINPYHQLGYPDLFFTHSSKNNRILENVTYGGSVPTIIPYKYEYNYDADGYPSVLYISYKGYTSGQHLYRIKRIFQYR